MKKESKVLLLFALLLVNSAPAVSQEDLGEEDLQSLLNESSPPQEVDESAIGSEDTADLSSETVDVENIDPTTTELDTTEPVISDDVEVEAVPPTQSFSVNEENSSTEDDLESLKFDTEDTVHPEAIVEDTSPKEEKGPEAPIPSTIAAPTKVTPDIFDVGKEEKELLNTAQNIQGQISDNEWNEVATAAKVETYTVVPNDWLFKISKRIFGTGFYYPKIWSLNTFITNPHFIEPGMILSFTTGSGSKAPEVKLGAFTEDEVNAAPGSLGTDNAMDLANFGEDARPSWIDEKSNLEKQGVYFQYASEETMEDLTKAGEQALNREYEGYEPPRNEFDIIIPKNYDKSGFDKNSRIFYSVKEGFYLSTFVSTNIVQDFGAVTDGPDENIYFTKLDKAYVKFDETMNVLPGDKFSVYSSGGRVKHKNSDRTGYKYTIVGQIKTIRKIRDKWEVEFIEVAGTPQRGDRITAYTPKIERITKTYNSRLVEAAILATFQPMQTMLGFGDVIYLDRGRADGVEMGNVFEVYGFKDRSTQKNITDQPTYKLGELTVITLTDNFATALVTGSIRDFYAGDIAITKTKEAYLREKKAKELRMNGQKDALGGRALEELDVELNLENLNDDLLKKADEIQLTEDELAELERQEREKSVIKDSERDLKALERLENEIEQAESILNDARLDEDKLLEGESLNDLEKRRQNIDQDSLNEIEENLGKRYLDEDLNSKENPYGLTEFDVEEVDELLNIEKK